MYPSRPSADSDPRCHTVGLVAQHVAMQHPGSRIAQDDENIPRLAGIQIGRVPVWTGFTRRIEFPEMVAMQMHDVWKPGFVADRNARGRPLRDG